MLRIFFLTSGKLNRHRSYAQKQQDITDYNSNKTKWIQISQNRMTNAFRAQGWCIVRE